MTAGRTARYLAEAGLLWTCGLIFGAMPVDAASALGGWIGRTIGPRLAASRKADDNLLQAMPELDSATRRRIVSEMWDNLGRVIAEYPHLETIAASRTTIDDIGLFERLRDDGRPGVVVSGHMANWEIAAPACLMQIGLPLGAIYREPNNPWAAKLLDRMRRIDPSMLNVKKSKSGTRMIVQAMKQGRHIALLIDQKYNEGVPVNFFGRPAMASPMYIHLAKRFECPLIMARFERVGGSRFRISAMEIPCFRDDGDPIPDDELLRVTHEHLEKWIRERPGQWLWLHRRWSGRAEHFPLSHLGRGNQ